jgi:antitoxin component YwqK of YwqJK toxin-antitoxin module
MKYWIILLFIFYLHTSFAQNDIKLQLNSQELESKIKLDSSYMNYYIRELTDTIWFTAYSEVIQCNYMVKLNKSHNNCTFYSNKKAMNGFFTICIVNKEWKEIYKGTMKNGHYENGAISRSYTDGTIQMTGQYQGNWKIGFWTTYHKNGRIDAIMKFMEGADYPVVEIEYDESGGIIYSNDEENTILKIISKD